MEVYTVPKLTIAKLKEIQKIQVEELRCKAKQYESYWDEERKKNGQLKTQLKNLVDKVEELKPYREQVRHIRYVTSYQFYQLNPDVCFPPGEEDARVITAWSLSLSFIYNITTDPDYTPYRGY